MPPVTDPLALAVLQRVPFLHEVPSAALQEMAAALPLEQIEAGEIIARQGQPARALLILIQGKAQVVRREAQAEPRPLGTLVPGDLFGEMELVHERAFHADLVAAEACTVLVWERRALEAALKPWPGAVRSLRFAADGRLLALQLRLGWLAEGETVLAASRKDVNILLQSLSLPVVLAGIGAGLAAWGLGGVLGWAGLVVLALGLGYGLWRWLDWRNDYYLVTDRRAVWLEKVIGLYDSRQEAPLQMVLSVSVSTDFLGRSLGYGDVVIRTFTGQLTFHNVRLPKTMAAVLEEGWRRVRQARDREDREGVSEALHQHLEAAGGEPEPVAEAALPRLPSEPTRPQEGVGLDHWTFQVRFEQGGVITYRKHWAVLLHSIAPPSMLVLLLVGVVGAGLGGLIRMSASGAGYLIAGLLLIPAFGWWVYRYVDWANDLYQITPEQIVDVYKRPLSRELRKVAPLENILGTQVQRRGIIGLLLDYGDVVAEVGTAQFTFDGVYHPAQVQQDIVHAQETLLERRREADRLQRRGELVEWFTAYHEETRAPQEGQPEDA
jgi:CRP-like cAMP-binding protein